MGTKGNMRVRYKRAISSYDNRSRPNFLKVKKMLLGNSQDWVNGYSDYDIYDGFNKKPKVKKIKASDLFEKKAILEFKAKIRKLQLELAETKKELKEFTDSAIHKAHKTRLRRRAKKEVKAVPAVERFIDLS